MAYSSSTSSSTSTSTQLGTASGDEASTYLTTTEATLQVTSPDGSDGLAGGLTADGLAVGDDTLVVADLSATMAGGGAVTTFDGEANVLAAAEDADSAFASATTSGHSSAGAEIVLTVNSTTQSTYQSSTQSAMVATSSTDIYAANISTGGGSEGADAGSGGEETLPDGNLPGYDAETDLALDGNVTIVEFSADAVGDDTLVIVDVFALSIEDELSVGTAFVELAVS